MKKKIAILLVLVMIATTLAACSSGAKSAAASKDAKHTIKIGIILNEESSWYKLSEKFKEQLEKESNGRITVEVYPNSQLGDNIKMLTELRAGTLEAAIMTTNNLSSVDKKWLLFDAAFMIPNQEVADKLFAGPLAEKLRNSLTDHDLVGIGYADFGFRQLINNVRPVKTMADFKGLKIRTQENPLHLEAFKAIGANPTPMPFSEVFTALNQGAIDGQENPISLILAQKYYEVQKYLTLSNHVYSTGMFLFSEKAWNKYSPEDQELIKKVAAEALEYGKQYNRDANAKAQAELEAKGMIINELSPEAQAELRNASKDVLYKFQNDIGKDLIDELNTELNTYMK